MLNKDQLQIVETNLCRLLYNRDPSPKLTKNDLFNFFLEKVKQNPKPLDLITYDL